MNNLLAATGLHPDRCLLDVNGYRVHHLAMGQGRPVLLLHGGGGGGANWYRVMRLLSGSFRLLAPDLPGFGLSAPQPTRHDLGTQAAEVLRAWADLVCTTECDVVATSFGGLAALRLAQVAPDHIRRLVLLDTVGFGRHLPLPVRLASLPLLGGWLQTPSHAGTRWLFHTLLVTDATTIPPAERDLLISYLWASARAAHSTMSVALSRFAGLRGQREILTDDELRAWRHRTLLLWGSRDRFLPAAHGTRAARLMPEARYHEIAGAGHSPNWERPEEVAEQIRAFLLAP